MNAKSFADWIKKRRGRKGLTLKEFHKQFNKFLTSKGSKLNRSYQWVTGLEKFGVFENELELVNALVQFFGYRIAFLPKDKINDLTVSEKMEIEQRIKDEKAIEEKNKERLTQKNIADKSW